MNGKNGNKIMFMVNSQSFSDTTKYPWVKLEMRHIHKGKFEMQTIQSSI